MADMELAKKGQQEPRLGIVQQLGVLIALATHHETALEPWGWTPEDTAELQRIKALLESELAEQAEAKDGSKVATRTQNAALSEAKQLKRRLDRAVNSVFRREKDLPVTREAFEAGGTIKSSVPKMVGWLVKVRPSVEALSTRLAKRLGGMDPVATLDAAKAKLETADVVQERSLQDLPGETLAVYEAKGRALLLIAELNDAGRNAFDDDANEAAKFNKDIIVRARKARPAKVPMVA